MRGQVIDDLASFFPFDFKGLKPPDRSQGCLGRTKFEDDAEL